MERLKKKKPDQLEFIKGQVTGPISFGLTVTDENKRSLIYNRDLADALVKLLAMKAKWQIEMFKKIWPRTIIFIDEPYLVSVGSAYVNLKKEEVIKKIDEVITAIHSSGGLTGVHCCGNTDWSWLLSTKVDILSFDAYNFAESLSLYPDELRLFFNRGGVLSWGIVPAAEAAWDETIENLVGRLEKSMELLVNKGIKKEVITSSLITPSCGTGTLSVKLAERILQLSNQLSLRMKEKYE